MAKKSVFQRNLNRAKKVKSFEKKRNELKEISRNTEMSLEERFKARLALAQLPRNSAKIRLRNRCELTGRGRGFYRKFKISRIMLRKMASEGLIPGVVKASW